MKGSCAFFEGLGSSPRKRMIRTRKTTGMGEGPPYPHWGRLGAMGARAGREPRDITKPRGSAPGRPPAYLYTPSPGEIAHNAKFGS